VLHVSSVAKFQKGVYIAVGEGTEDIEVRQIASIDSASNTLMLGNPYTNTPDPIQTAHAAGDWTGTEFTQYRWYPDVQLDNIFWHDHVDGIHGWRHGAVGQLVIEPKGSSYHDPQTGKEIASGPIADIWVPQGGGHLADGLVEGSFRELVLWTIDDTPIGTLSTVQKGNVPNVDTLNLRAAPLGDRLTKNPDPSLLFSSYAHGDPPTPLFQAYPGDPLVIRTINVSANVDTLHVDGIPFANETRYTDANGKPEGSPIDTIHYGVSERYTIVARNGAPQAGDYLYGNGIGKRFQNGAWGIIRVLNGKDTNRLEELPGYPAPSNVASNPSQTGGRPPATTNPGNPCPVGAKPVSFDVSAVNVPSSNVVNGSVRLAYVPTAQAAAVAAKTVLPEPLVLHVAAGDCITVNFTNRTGGRASFHMSKLAHSPASSGINIGYSSEQTVPANGTRRYVYYAQSADVRSALVNDFGGNNTGTKGLYGALVVGPKGATFTDPATGAATNFGSSVDVHDPNGPDYRDFTLIFSDINDFEFGQSGMPYPPFVNGQAMVNYRTAGTNIQSVQLGDTGNFAAITPNTPVLKAYAGDPVQVHALVANGSEQMHVLNLGGMAWPLDQNLLGAQKVANEAVGPWESLDANIVGGAGWGQVGDFFYGDMRRGYTQAGMWGIQRVFAAPTSSSSPCPIKSLEGGVCK
jgi:hypothetical protein